MRRSNGSKLLCYSKSERSDNSMINRLDSICSLIVVDEREIAVSWKKWARSDMQKLFPLHAPQQDAAQRHHFNFPKRVSLPRPFVNHMTWYLTRRTNHISISATAVPVSPSVRLLSSNVCFNSTPWSPAESDNMASAVKGSLPIGEIVLTLIIDAYVLSSCRGP